MRTSYCLPSGTYNIILSNNELNELVRNGCMLIRLSRIPCKASRIIFNDEKEQMEVLDKKKVDNCLFFHTDEPVADIEAGDQYVQFLCINVEKPKDVNISDNDNTKCKVCNQS